MIPAEPRWAPSLRRPNPTTPMGTPKRHFIRSKVPHLAVAQNFVVYAVHKQLAHVWLRPRIDWCDLKCIVFSCGVDQFPPNFPLRALGNRAPSASLSHRTQTDDSTRNKSFNYLKFNINFIQFGMQHFVLFLKLLRCPLCNAVVASAINRWKLFESS